MNNPKITLEQFNQYKERCKSIVDKMEDVYEQNTNNPNFDMNKFYEQFMQRYLEVQNELLKFDLSLIPYDGWRDFTILSSKDHPVDFSGTYANIDFSIFQYNDDAEINFKGCNIRNLSSLNRMLKSSDFDKVVVDNNKEMFVSDLFSQEFQKKLFDNELTIQDLVTLNPAQLKEFNNKNFINSVVDSNSKKFINLVGLDNLIGLYNFSANDFQIVSDLFRKLGFHFLSNNSAKEIFKNIEPSEIKKAFYSLERQFILSNSYDEIKLENYPDEFLKENDDIFMLNVNISDDLRQRFYNRELTFDDIKNNIFLFRNFSISNFISRTERSNELVDFERVVTVLGDKNISEFLSIYPEMLNYIIKGNLAIDFSEFVRNRDKLELNGSIDDKRILISYLEPFLTTKNKLINANQLMLYDYSFFQLEEKQNRVIQTLGLENIKRFESELGFFSHRGNQWSEELEGLSALESFFNINKLNAIVEFKNGTLNYEDFVNEMANCLDAMRRVNIFNKFSNYDWIQGKFREQHPKIFMDMDAPVELKNAFYVNKITPQVIQQHPEYVKYLLDKNMVNTVNASIFLNVPNMIDSNGNIVVSSINFIKEYTERYGNEAFLELCSKYGSLLWSINVESLHNEINNKQDIERNFRNSISKKIVQCYLSIEELKDIPEFVNEYPDMFIDLSSLNSIPKEEQQRLTMAFYRRELKFEDLKKYPELAIYLRSKNLLVGFGKYNDLSAIKEARNKRTRDNNTMPEYSDMELLAVFGKDKFLELCTKYGKYMEGVNSKLCQYLLVDNGHYITRNERKVLSFEDVKKEIEKYITDECLKGNIQFHLNDAPEFLLQNHPELFLGKDAPKELQDSFYDVDGKHSFSFETIREHREWLPYLQGKAVNVALLRCYNGKIGGRVNEYFKLFGDRALQIGMNKTETVNQMIQSNQVELMKQWYDKTGGKFIPDYVVMQNFPIEQADKFLLAGSNWSSLMRIKSFSKTAESRDAMLKLAYSFGAFDQDQRGFKKLQELLTSLPKNISPNYTHIITNILALEDESSEYLQLREMLAREGFKLDFDQKIFSQIYKKNENGSYSLMINQQNYPKSSQIIRNIIEMYPDAPIITPEKAHQLFGGFDLKYDAEFREFLLANMGEILENPAYGSFVASIQKQFSEIKSINSNRVLTWDLAMSYIQTKKYVGVNAGNERVAEISSIAGYTQNNFETLQQIYNYGKQRTFSSIPRIENKNGTYTYEMLRLDDPLAMAIGTLTDCCQELGNCAEVCMEHSMVDKNGRVFVVYDKLGNIVAQSWVWRNKDVLCFDNIEIPDKAFARAIRENPELGRKGFTDQIFQIYKQAAQNLIESDEVEYKKLLDEGKITQEQYDGLRLGKVTVGLGYNDIAESLKQNSFADNNVSRPLHFEEPVKLSRGLYTNDSMTQYVLEQRNDRKEYAGETPAVHADTYIEYDDNSFTEKQLLGLEKLELLTKQNVNYLNTQLGNYDNKEHVVSTLAHNYGLNPKTTRIVMNPNFAIIYDVNGEQLKIGDLLYNTVIDNNQQQMNIEDKVIIQLKLALEQIAQNKKIDVSSLNNSQLAMYSKAIGLAEEIDYERGVGHAK